MRSVMNSMRLFGAWLPWKPCSWYSARTKLFELNRSATEWRCLVWKIIMGELIFMNLCRPALGVQFFRHSVVTRKALAGGGTVNFTAILLIYPFPVQLRFTFTLSQLVPVVTLNYELDLWLWPTNLTNYYSQNHPPCNSSTNCFTSCKKMVKIGIVVLT